MSWRWYMSSGEKAELLSLSSCVKPMIEIFSVHLISKRRRRLVALHSLGSSHWLNIFIINLYYKWLIEESWEKSLHCISFSHIHLLRGRQWRHSLEGREDFEAAWTKQRIWVSSLGENFDDKWKLVANKQRHSRVGSASMKRKWRV